MNHHLSICIIVFAYSFSAQISIAVPLLPHYGLNIHFESADALCTSKGSRHDSDKPQCVCPVGTHLRLTDTTVGAGPRTYYFGGPLAQLELALVQFALDRLNQTGFSLVSVPDILPEPIIEACGFPTRGIRSQVYRLCTSPGSELTYCLSGTAEMGLASFCAGRTFDYDDGTTSTAVGLCAVSRCFRQEAPHQEPPLYRVHQFTKVDLFRWPTDAMFDNLVRLQIGMFADLGLHFRVLEMPTSELGSSAHRKIDIEAWMPGSEMFGEVNTIISTFLQFQFLQPSTMHFRAVFWLPIWIKRQNEDWNVESRVKRKIENSYRLLKLRE
ncbi:unnamed protein product [Echinostoma caproni]|uniref:serine--tRNA ligase n=1 Tax=Echinostoma caproni TaxID=27848 RepID=A0A3P8I8H3_9TREM|nr:unnamed protein product [Echinostoma caproni]